MRIKTREELVKAYIEFFKEKGHKEVPSASLIPENDPTVLFTTAGMQPLSPYLIGEKHPLGEKLVSVQKCIRTQDIDEVGDEFHHTFFEMLGNWSFGDYFKKEAIEYSFEFLTRVLKIPFEKIAVSVFSGDKDSQQDIDSALIWKSLGISEKRIAYLPKKNNWWGPVGKTGVCGPDTEMFYWSGEGKVPEKFDHEDKRWVEIWNDVFMHYNKTQIKLILVDAINCLIDKENGLNRELAEILKNKNKKIIVVTNADIKEIKSKLNGYDFEVFSLMKNPDKSNPDYFREFLKRYNLKKEEIIYFDHKEENVKSAKQVGIVSEIYKNNKQIKDFIEKNSYRYETLKQKNVDTGMGVERTIAVLNGFGDNYLTTIFEPIIRELTIISGKRYEAENKKAMRIIADHLRAATFILGDERGVKPSNVEQGYVLRRLVRRAIRYARILGIKEKFTKNVAEVVILLYDDYPELKKNKEFILSELGREEGRFMMTIVKGLKKFEEIIGNSHKIISGKDAFLLFQSYGFPIEMTVELAREKKFEVDVVSYDEEYKKHQELSRTLSAGVFKSGLADDSEKTTRLHTVTHLLNEALKVVLNDRNIKQRGSNITPERLRFDFNFNRKLTKEELEEIEKLVNKKIKEGLNVVRKEMPLKEAIKFGAQSEFGAKYPDVVSVYIIKDSKDHRGWFSCEICTGPHVKNTNEIGNFRIIKEESVAAGIRRIKAVV
ncbi:HAD-IA family hydrolase [Candidatus Pacearchaeota archaeon]|nr:HAD-IA family hydrolase [Candidatus Pacearchaeota archaeon]